MNEDREKYEWKEMPPEAAIRQGDLLIARNRKTRAVERMVVVITADCDIDKNKFGPQIACLNIQFHDEYVRSTWAARALEVARDKALANVVEKIRAVHAQTVGGSSTLSKSAIEDWLVRESPTSIARELNVSESSIEGFVKFISPCHAALRAISTTQASSPFEQLQLFSCAYKGETIPQVSAELLRKAQADTLPSDTFLIPGSPVDPSRPVLILLRELVGIPSEHVRTRQSDVLDHNYYLRVGRLRSTFKFALSQAFGSLYSKIGLPSAYERRRKHSLTGTLSYEWK